MSTCRGTDQHQDWIPVKALRTCSSKLNLLNLARGTNPAGDSLKTLNNASNNHVPRHLPAQGPKPKSDPRDDPDDIPGPEDEADAYKKDTGDEDNAHDSASQLGSKRSNHKSEVDIQTKNVNGQGPENNMKSRPRPGKTKAMRATGPRTRSQDRGSEKLGTKLRIRPPRMMTN